MKIRLVDSDPERRRGTKFLRLGLVLVAALAVLWLGYSPRSRAPASYEITSNLSAVSDSAVIAVDRLAAFTVESSDSGARFDDKRAADGLLHVASVLDLVIRRDTLGTSIYSSLPDDIRADAKRLRAEKNSVDRAVVARKAVVAVSEAVSVWQRRSYPYLERAASRLLDAAGSIQADRPLLEQKTQLEEFFEAACDALRGMTLAQL